ncbi:hypothetical protein TNCV_1085341 [Trichonephila clavipes]|nr:hypothetical protein TNCV_1085341 [Trichonephila clavipes]
MRRNLLEKVILVESSPGEKMKLAFIPLCNKNLQIGLKGIIVCGGIMCLDHNSIEYVWDGLRKAISQRLSQDLQELKVQHLKQRALLPQTLIETLINSIAARSEACIAVHSG